MKTIIRQRKYHVYKYASQTLKIFEHDLNTKQKIIHEAIDKQANKKIPVSSIFRDIKKSRPLKDAKYNQEVLDASLNIRTLCDRAYTAFHQVENNLSPDLDEELVDFIELTNHMYPCVPKELYERLLGAHRGQLFKLQKSA